MGKVTVEMIKLSRLPHTNQFQVRDSGVDEFHVHRMAEVYRAWKAQADAGEGVECPIPPPDVFLIGGVYHPVAGFNRLAGMREAGLTEAVVRVHTGFSVPQAKLFSAQSNLENTGLPLNKASTKTALLMYYDNSPDAATLTDEFLAKKYRVHRTTVMRWLKDHDASRSDQTERKDGDGKTHKVNAKPKPKEPDADLFAPDDAETPPPRADARPPEVVVPAGPVTPTVPSPENRPERKAGEYPPDERFMPNAAEAAKLAAAFRSVVARMTAVKSEMKALLPDPQHPIANRMHLHTTFLPRLAELIEDVVANTPTHTCPRCAGTTVKADGKDCRECGGYGLVAAGDADQMKGAWAKGSGEWYDRLVREADLTEAMA